MSFMLNSSTNKLEISFLLLLYSLIVHFLFMKVAIKMFDKSALDHEKQLRLHREIESMKRLKHQNIIRLYEVKNTF